MTRLSSPSTEIDPSYEAIVVGSGYGGGVAASRLARMGLRVAVLERGTERRPGEFPDEPSEAVAEAQAEGRFGRVGRRSALFDLHVGDDISVLVGCGLGGTSLINANVALRADPRVFADPGWPRALREEGEDGPLAEGYRRAEAMLVPRPYPDGAEWPKLNKLEAMGAAAAALGAQVARPPINVNFEPGLNSAGVWQPACNLCGDCCSGCNTGAKNTTLMNYLPDAAAFGAKIFCGIRVRSVERRADGLWTVRYVLDGVGLETFEAGEMALAAGIVVLAAGTLGSTEILLRSHDRGLPLSGVLGSRLGGSGDVLAFGYNNDVPIDGIGLGREAMNYRWQHSLRRPVGPTIAGLIDLRDETNVDAGIVIEEGAIPGGLAAFLPVILAAAAQAHGDDTDEGDRLHESAREIESLVLGAYRGAVNHTQTFLVMSHDGAGGRLALDGDRLDVHWPEVGKLPLFEQIAEKLRAAAAAIGGTFVPNPIWTDLMDKNLVTVHPLGGCPMADDAADGVVDDGCRVFSDVRGTAVHDGLYVCDGAVVPRSLGVNPLLTITALAERAMIKLAKSRELELDMRPAATTPADALHRPVGLRFTEKMGGEIRSTADGSASPAHFVITVIAHDADRLLDEPAHEADIIGSVEAPALSPGPLTIVGGRFNLFTSAGDGSATRHMRYRLPLAARDGQRFYFAGRKDIRDDPGFDVWHDTSTLQVSIHAGADDSGPRLFEGKLTIALRDFVRQLTTTTAVDAPSLRARLGVMARFLRFFAGQLVETYAPPAPQQEATLAPAPRLPNRPAD